MMSDSQADKLGRFNPLTPTVAIWYTYSYPVPDRVNPSFVIFDIRELWRHDIIRHDTIQEFTVD